jgi:hypothetical protein
LFPKSRLAQKMRPNDHSAMGGQTLVGKSPDPHVIFQKVKKSAFSHYFCMDIK